MKAELEKIKREKIYINMFADQQRLIDRLIAALEKCVEQRDANYDGPLPDQAVERADAELSRILSGGRTFEDLTADEKKQPANPRLK